MHTWLLPHITVQALQHHDGINMYRWRLLCFEQAAATWPIGGVYCTW